MKQNRTNFSYFFYFLLFNLYFFCLQVGLLYSQNDSFVSSVTLPEIAWQQILATVGLHIVLYLLLSLIQTFMLLGILKRSWHHFSADQWQIIIWILCICAILSANAYYFPLSVFSKLFSPPIPELVMLIVLGSSGFALSLLLLNSLFYRQGMYLLLVAIPVIFVLNNFNTKTIELPHNTKPNVIIIGIDSLSPESINSENMPFFLN